MERHYQDNLKNQTVLLPEDFAGEVMYAFDGLPENQRRNLEIIARAEARARIRLGDGR